MKSSFVSQKLRYIYISSLCVFFFLSFFLSFFSCKKTIQTPSTNSLNSGAGSEETNSSKKEAEEKDHDPYFTESTAITSPYGPWSIVRNILPDSKGNIWLATWLGIIHYDGKTFTNLTNKEGLRRYRVFCMLEDRKGNIWFGTVGAGIYLYDGEKFTNLTTKDGLADDKIGTIYEDSAGNIWIGTMGGGISIYDGKTFENYTKILGLPDEDINSIVEDEEGKFWIGCRGEAFLYDPSTSMMSLLKTFSKIKKEDESTFTNVRCIIKDSKGNIWLGGNDGLWRFDGKTFSKLTKNFTGYIYEDSKGNIWTSSESDTNRNWVLSRYDAQSLLDENPKAVQVKTEENMFFGIKEDKEGAIWFGTLRGAYRYD